LDELMPLKELKQIENEINLLKQQTAQNIIEIGKRLLRAKEGTEHGQWQIWLETKVNFKKSTANNFMRVAKEMENFQALGDLGQTKVFALLELPANDRETFIEENKVEDMTTRELQQAIKEKKALEKEVELSKLRESRLIDQVEELEKQPEKVKEVVKEIIPSDYHSIKKSLLTLEHKAQDKDLEIERLQKEKEILERKAKLNEKEAGQYNDLKTQIGNMTKQKDDISRQLNSATELSGLVVMIEHILKTELAPIKYSRAINECKENGTVQRNLKDIIDRVSDWCSEMERYLPQKGFTEFEILDEVVIDYE